MKSPILDKYVQVDENVLDHPYAASSLQRLCHSGFLENLKNK
jgi:hypothetical protein